MDTILEQGAALIQALQGWSPALDGVMRLFTFMGTVEFYLLFLPILYWNISPTIGFRSLLVLLTAETLSTSFKLLLHQPRPYWLGGVETLAEEPTYGLPSSHASDSVAIWGYLAYHIRRAWVYLIVGILLLLIGISRLYLGVHFPHDVLAGWGIGLLVLAVFIVLEEPASRRLGGMSAAAQMSLGLFASLAIIIAGAAMRASIAGAADPTEWASFALEARSLSPFFTLGGTLFGSVAGYVLMNARAPFRPGGRSGRRLMRYLLGIGGVILIWRGLDIVFAMAAADESILGLVLRYVRYAGTAFWVLFGAPWLFLRLRMVEEG